MMILQQAPDLSSIYALICASSRANAAFEIDSARILDAAIERSIPEFKHLTCMIAIMGSFSSSSPPTFKELVVKYKSRPRDEPKKAYAAGTQGPRYLVLTAYRIEILQNLCLVTLLQKFHDEVWSHERVKKFQSRTGLSLAPCSWSPSWTERRRVVRALWKLMIYWNIHAIRQDLREEEDCWFYHYNDILQHLSPALGPFAGSEDIEDADNVEQEVSHDLECEEFSCVSIAAMVSLGRRDAPEMEIFTPFSSQDCSKFWILKEVFPIIQKKKTPWGPEEPKLPEKQSPLRKDVFQPNTSLTEYFADYWLKYYDIRCYDTCGIYIWDMNRLAYMHFILTGVGS